MTTDAVTINPWHVETSPLRKRHLGKTLEEVGELISELGTLSSIVARCGIQGIDEVDPSSGKTNRLRLEEELADVYAQMGLLAEVFNLDRQFIASRVVVKRSHMHTWNNLLSLQGEDNATQTNPV